LHRKVTLATIAVVVLGAWALCAWVYHADGTGPYAHGFVLFPIVAGLLTIGSAAVTARAWRNEGGALVPGLVSAVAVASTLVVAFAIYIHGA
jgi:hypothetical protein